jgi:hypothetical protein
MGGDMARVGGGEGAVANRGIGFDETAGEKPSSGEGLEAALVTRMGGAWSLKGDAVVLLCADCGDWYCVGDDPRSAAEYLSTVGVFIIEGKPGVRGVWAKPGVLGAD